MLHSIIQSIYSASLLIFCFELFVDGMLRVCARKSTPPLICRRRFSFYFLRSFFFGPYATSMACAHTPRARRAIFHSLLNIRFTHQPMSMKLFFTLKSMKGLYCGKTSQLTDLYIICNSSSYLVRVRSTIVAMQSIPRPS